LVYRWLLVFLISYFHFYPYENFSQLRCLENNWFLFLLHIFIFLLLALTLMWYFGSCSTDWWRRWCILWTEDRYQCIRCIKEEISVCHIAGSDCWHLFFLAFWLFYSNAEFSCSEWMSVSVCSLTSSFQIVLSWNIQLRMKPEVKHLLWYIERS
jgi:hypothetical protein